MHFYAEVCLQWRQRRDAIGKVSCTMTLNKRTGVVSGEKKWEFE